MTSFFASLGVVSTFGLSFGTVLTCNDGFGGFYLALFNVWLVVLSCGGFVWLDQDVSFNTNFYKKNSFDSTERGKNIDYNPT